MNAQEEKDSVTTEYTIITLLYQNRPTKRVIQTIENIIRTITKGVGLLAKFQCFTIETDTYVKNRLLGGLKIEGKKTCPKEVYTSIK